MWTRFLICLFFIAWNACPAVRAQQMSVHGTVLTSRREPVEFATVLLWPARDSSRVQATVADAQGAFVLRGVAPGSYRLRASFMGLEPKSQPLVVVAGEVPSAIVLQLVAAPQQLAEVQVTASRPRITQLPDRLILDVANTPLAAGYTALEVLAKAPGVYIDPRSESVSLNGKGTMVVLDGKRTYLSGSDLAALLKSLGSQEIQKVELITSPGAKYDAEGPGGVINIITKKSQLDGTRGSLTLGAGGVTNSRQTAGFSLNHKHGPLALYGGYTLAGRQTEVSEQAQLEYLAGPERAVTATHLLTSVTPTRQLGHTFKAGLDWQASAKTSVNLYVRGLRTDRSSTTEAATRLLHDPATPDSVLTSHTDARTSITQLAGNLGLQHRVDSASALTANLDYSRYESGQRNLIRNAFVTGQGELPGYGLQLRNYLPKSIRIVAGQLDYERTLRPGKLELGAKHSYVTAENDARYELLQAGDWQNDALRTNFFSYQEHISAAYATFAGKRQRLEYRVGLRLEQTNSVGYLHTTEVEARRAYLSLFPSVLLSRAVGQGNYVSLDYGRRIQRPSYQDLNPFIYFQDVYTYSQGNPFLRPEFTHALDLTYTLRSTYVLALGYSQTSDVIAWVTQREVPGSLVTQTRAENLNSQRQWTLTTTVPLSPRKWWTITNALQASYTSFLLRGVANAPRTVQGLAAVYSLANDFAVPGGWNLSASGYFQSPQPSGVTQTRGQYSVNLGLQKKFRQDRLALRVVYNDVLRTARAVSLTEFDNLRSRSTYRWDSHFFLATLTYQLGNQKVKAANKNRSVSGDEESRIK